MSSDQPLGPYHQVPDRALLQGIRRSLYRRRAIAWSPVSRRTVEGTVEVAGRAENVSTPLPGPARGPTTERSDEPLHPSFRPTLMIFGSGPDRDKQEAGVSQRPRVQCATIFYGEAQGRRGSLRGRAGRGRCQRRQAHRISRRSAGPSPSGPRDGHGSSGQEPRRRRTSPRALT